MSRTDRVRRALAALRAQSVADSAISADERPNPRAAVLAANALLEAAETELIKAEIATYHTEFDHSDVDRLIDDLQAAEARDSTPTRHMLLQWRAARLHQTFDRFLNEANETDPVLTAAGDAAMLASTLVCYRESSELLMTSHRLSDLQQVPGTTLAATLLLVDRIAQNVQKLAS